MLGENMKPMTVKMLKILQYSANKNTATHAADILYDRQVPFAPTIPALKLAEQGRLGGFLQAVVGGNLDEAYRLADPLNTAALDDLRR